MLLSNWPPLRPDQERRPSVPTRYMQQKLWRTTNHKLRLSVLASNPPTTTKIVRNNQNATTTNSSVRNNKTNPGDKALATTPTKTDKPVFFAGYRVIVKRSVAKELRLTNHAWTPMDAHSGPR
jgi:hypothetical protein